MPKRIGGGVIESQSWLRRGIMPRSGAVRHRAPDRYGIYIWSRCTAGIREGESSVPDKPIDIEARESSTERGSRFTPGGLAGEAGWYIGVCLGLALLARL